MSQLDPIFAAALPSRFTSEAEARESSLWDRRADRQPGRRYREFDKTIAENKFLIPKLEAKRSYVSAMPPSPN